MPRIKRTQKEVEKFLIREFVGILGYSISKPDWTERPDAILTLRTKGVRKRIGIEHTDYFNDTVAGERSPLTPIEDFWEDVQTSLMHRVSHRKHLCGIDVRVTLKNDLPVLNHDPELAKQERKRLAKNRAKIAKNLAKNLVAFLESHPIRLKKPEFFKRCKRGDCPFGDYPFLDSYLSSVYVSRHLDIATSTYRTCWTCNNLSTGVMGINLDYIKSAITEKNKKAVKYEWKNAKEKWLLIVAGSGNVSQNAGRLLQEAIFDDDELITLCRESPFDNIVFWERVRYWYKNLKPIKKAVRYKNPYPFATPST